MRIGEESIIGFLVEEHIRQSKESLYKPLLKHDGWSLEVFYFHRAARFGWATIISSLLNLGVMPDALDVGEERTALCVAATWGHADIVSTLLTAKADQSFTTKTTRDTPFGLAIMNGKKDTVKVLIDAGVETVIKIKNAKGESPKALAKHFPDIFNMVAAEDEGDPLGNAERLHADVDHEFKATIIEIWNNEDQPELEVTEIAVDELLANPRYPFKVGEERLIPSLRWLHLPANNVSYMVLCLWCLPCLAQGIPNVRAMHQRLLCRLTQMYPVYEGGI